MVAPGLRAAGTAVALLAARRKCVPEYAVQDYFYAVRLGLAFSLLGVVLLLVL